MENSERVTNFTIEDLYADGAYQSPENREFAKEHNDMQLKTGKMQGGCRWELIPHDEDGLTVREIATGNTFEAVKAVTNQGTRKRWRIPWTGKTGWRYFEDKDIKAYLLRKQIESLPPEEQHKRNRSTSGRLQGKNVEAAMFQYSFHTLGRQDQIGTSSCARQNLSKLGSALAFRKLQTFEIPRQTGFRRTPSLLA